VADVVTIPTAIVGRVGVSPSGMSMGAGDDATEVNGQQGVNWVRLRDR
jgi:hypothetical protein